MKRIIPKAVLLIVIITSSALNRLYAQELKKIAPRYTNETIRGNLTMTANDIVGLVYKNGFLDPNDPYNVNNSSNGDNVTAYIDVDNDPTTFSSSSANLTVPRENCGKIVYAGLYWSANYYMARRDSAAFYDLDEISTDSTNVRLIVNNSPIAKDYVARSSEFVNDNSDIRLSPVTSYLVVAQPESGCGITNGAALAGNIAVIRNTGSCSLREKVVNAQTAGAVGVVIVHNNGNLPKLAGNGPTINIPSVSIGNDDISNGNFNNADLITLLQAEPNVVLATLSTTGDAQLSGLPLTDPRRQGPANFENVKFKVPNGNYVDLTAESIVWDGYRNTPTNNSNTANDEVQYVCYSEVTNLIDPANPFGMYTVANINATQGYTSTADGACGGWVLVVVYEDPIESSKFISTQDGYVQIFSSAPNPVDFSFSGFRTLQGNQPVDVLFGVAALEGDKAFLQDQLLIETPPIGSNTFTALGEGFNNFTDINPVRNFFNSSITIDNNFITNRVPASENTLGFDADLFRLPNEGNRLIGNNQTNANFRIDTGNDRYGVFFGAFSVTVIEPELQIIKRVFDVDGVTDITDQTVELGDEVFYELEIENIGNEDFVDGSVVITDVLPVNMDLLEVVSVPAGITFTPDTTTNSIVFQIPSDIVETPNDQPIGEGDGPIFIRFRAKLVSTCEELRDACSNIITNSASAVFTGAVSTTDARTFSTAELGPCGENLGEVSNILVNVPACRQEVVACNSTLQLIAGTGYSQYTWTGPSISGSLVQTGPNANILDISDVQSGVYTVVKEDIDGVEPSCMTLTEEFNVDSFRDIENPILTYVNGDTVITASCSGLELPQILLCGDQTFELQTGFDPSGIDSISWQRLAPSGDCILDPNDPCSLLDGNCTDTNWIEEPDGNTPNFTVEIAGDYRIMVEFSGGCVIPFYFSVFKNDYQPELAMQPIECGNDGSITVTNVPTNFAFSLTSGGPYTNTNGVFAISSPGDITVYAIDTTFTGCEYEARINVPSIDPVFEVTTVPPTCVNDDSGSGTGRINISVTRGNPEYQYTISSSELADDIIVPNSSANNGNYTQRDLPPGDYTVEVISNRPAPECVESFDVTIAEAPAFEAEVVLLAPETCDRGALVQVNVLEGSGNYLYDNGDGNFVSCNIFEIPLPADPSRTYTFSVSDQNIPAGTPSCIIEASIDNISPYTPIVIDAVTVVQPPCPSDTGQIQVAVSPTVGGRLFTYQLWDCIADPNCGDPTNWDPALWSLVNEIPLATSQNITFANVAAGSNYVVTVLHNNPTAVINNPACSFPPLVSPICPVRQAVAPVVSPSAITADIDLKRGLSCIPSNENAIIEVSNITGGSGNYEWSFDNTNFTIFTGTSVEIPVATDGSYTIYIRNQGTNDCAIELVQGVPKVLPINDIIFVQSAIDCTTDKATLTFNADPAIGTAGVTYEYEVSPNPTTGAGTTGFVTTNSYTIDLGVVYTVTARRSDEQCTFVKTFVADPVPKIAITSADQTRPVTCLGGNDGALTFTVDTSIFSNFAFLVTGPAPSTARVNEGEFPSDPLLIENLAEGVYTITVTDRNPSITTPCTDTATVTITEPADEVQFDITLAQTCDTNTIGVTNVGGANGAAYTYTLTHPTNGTNLGPQAIDTPFTGMPSDDSTPYTVAVFDRTGVCTTEQTILIPTLPAVTLSLTGSELCLDDGIATLDIAIAGGTPNFTYTIARDGVQIIGNTPLGAGVRNFTTPDLTQAGTYVVTVTDSVGCSQQLTQVIAAPVTITASLLKDLDCTANPAASIGINITGGNGNVSLLVNFNGGGFTPIADPTITTYTAAAAGTYVFMVTDSANPACTDISNTITVTPAVSPVATVTPTNISCNGDTTGIISFVIDATVGTPPYLTSIDNGVTFSAQTIYSGLPAGNYDYIVQDAKECRLTGSVQVIEPDPINATIVAGVVSCSGAGSFDFAEITIEGVTGGTISTTGYRYRIYNSSDNTLVSDPLLTTGNDITTAVIPTPASPLIFEELNFGTYYITIEDENNCLFTSDPLIISSPPDRLDAIIVPSDSNCTTNGAVYDVIIRNGSRPFEIRIVDVPGFQNFTVTNGDIDGDTITNDLPPPPFVLDATPGGNVHQFSGLNFDIPYIVEVRDAGNCIYRQVIDPVSPPNGVTAEIRDLSNVTCTGSADGQVNFTFDGYTGNDVQWQIFNAASGTSITTGSATPGAAPYNGDIGGLDVGSYIILFSTPTEPFCTASIEFNITEPSPLSLDLIDTIDALCDLDSTPRPGQIVVIGRGGTSPYTYDTSTMGTFTNTTGTFNLPAATYDIYVRDANGCIASPVSATIIDTPVPSFTNLPIDFVDDPCIYDNNYTFTVNATGGVGDLSYGIDDGDPTTVDVPSFVTDIPNDGIFEFTVSRAGQYNFFVRDINGCLDTGTINVYDPLELTASFTTVPNCQNTDGVIRATITSGTAVGTLTFELQNASGAVIQAGVTGTSPFEFSNVAAGDYIVQVTDDGRANGGGCSFTTPVSITAPIAPILDIPTDLSISCNGVNDGVIDVQLQADTIDPTATYTYEITAGPTTRPAQSSSIFNNLGAGVYTVEVTATITNGVAPTTQDVVCIVSGDYTIADVTEPVATVAQGDQFDCDGNPNATIDITGITGGNGAPYTATVTRPDGTVIPSIALTTPNTSLEAPIPGGYDIQLFDTNGCPSIVYNVVIDAYTPMDNLQFVSTQDLTCANPDEIVRVTVDNGSGNFLFEVISAPSSVTTLPAPITTTGSNTAEFFNLPSVGTYVFRVTDLGNSNGLGLNCTIQGTYTIDEFDTMTVTAAQQAPVSCFGDVDGSISVGIAGYSDIYTYNVLDAVSGNILFTGNGDASTGVLILQGVAGTMELPQGTYIIEIVQDAPPNCTNRSNTVSITGPGTAIDATVSFINPTASCVPGGDGAIQATTTGGQGEVTYTLVKPADPLFSELNITGLFENLASGSYVLTARDGKGCTDVENFDIMRPTPIVVDPIPASSVSCFGATDGRIVVNASAGQGPNTYIYTLRFPDGTTTSGPQTTNEFTNLGPGRYTVTVSDNLNCGINVTTTINEPSEVTVTIDTVTQVTCAIDTIDVQISGSSDVAIATYVRVDRDGNEITNTTGQFTALTEGEYRFYVIDSNGCRSDFSAPVPVLPISDIVITLDESAAKINCFNESTAIITATVTGGIGAYVFELVNTTTSQTWGPQAENEFRDLPPGVYTYTVRSDRDCVSSANFTVQNPPEFTPTDEVTNVTCNGEDNGVIKILASGGTPPYSFAISSNPGIFFNDASDNIPNEHTFDRLAPGQYEVLAQDANGCDVVFMIDISEPPQLAAGIVGEITPETCAGDSDGAVTIDITGGISPYSTSITNNDADFVEGQLTFTGLPGGTTTIFIRDANNCPINLPVEVPEGVVLEATMNERFECPVWDLTDPTNPIIIQDEKYFVDFELGAASENTNLEFVLTPINGAPAPIPQAIEGQFEVFAPGEYQGTLRYTPTGCEFDAGVISVPEYTPLPLPIAQMTNNPRDPNEYEILVGTEGYNTEYIYSVAIIPEGQTFADITDISFTELATNIFTIDATASYALKVVDTRVASRPCEVVRVQDLEFINILIPNYFTPSGSSNQFWYPRQDPFKQPFFFGNMEVKVFDRYGRLLAEFVGDQGENGGWDGIYQGNDLPSGDYWYSIIMNDKNDRKFTGHFTLYR